MKPTTTAPPVSRPLPLRPQDEVECRRCEVHCDKVVHPAACVARACPFAYSYEAFGHRYMGCMQRVFIVEIDVEVLDVLERAGGFGAVRARRAPLPFCDAEIAACYESREDELGCRNPEFLEIPRERPSFRVIASGLLT